LVTTNFLFDYLPNRKHKTIHQRIIERKRKIVEPKSPYRGFSEIEQEKVFFVVPFIELEHLDIYFINTKGKSGTDTTEKLLKGQIIPDFLITADNKMYLGPSEGIAQIRKIVFEDKKEK
jgi:hypothetical protein